MLSPKGVLCWPWAYNAQGVCFRASGLEIMGCREPMASLNAPVAPSNFCREPKYILLDIQKPFYEAFEDAIGLPGRNLNFEP